MYQQINLYQPIFRKQRQIFSATTLAQVLGIVAAALLLLYGYGLLQVRGLEGEVVQLEGREQALITQLARIDPTQNQHRRTEVEEELKKLNAALLTQQRLIDVLREQPLGSQTGFSGYLAALGRERTPELWLTQFAINGSTGALELAGRSTRPELVPEYLQRLGREQALTGQRFDALRDRARHGERRSRVSRDEPGGGADRGRPRGEAQAMKERIAKDPRDHRPLELARAAVPVRRGARDPRRNVGSRAGGPARCPQAQATQKMEAIKTRLQTLDAALDSTATGMSEGMPAQLDQLTALRDRVAAGDQEVRAFTSDLVDPREMRHVLEELLRRQSGLKLVSATNLPAKSLVEDDAEPSVAKDDGA